MLINPLSTVNNNNNNKYIYPSPAFKMKMSELKGIDRFVAKKYKINPQPIKTLEAFQEKCKEMVEKIVGKDFLGRQQETTVQRKEMIKDWYNYVVKENGAYTSAMGLMILAGITNKLKPNEDTLPPALNKGVLADTVTKIQDEINGLKPNEEAQINFEKEYRLNLQRGILNEEKTLDENLNGWIIIPSKEHDSENFEANVDKLKMLSHDNWCTKSFNAEPYLAQGDFHVYMEQGKPKLGVRFVGDEIQEIQGELNNSKIPVKYGDIAKEHIKNYKLTKKANKELEKLEKTKAEIERIKSMFPDGINNAPAQKVLEALGIKCKQDSDGLLIISHYGDSILDYSYSDLEIDENRLFKYIKEIEGRANLKNSQVTDLGNLQTIGGNADFMYSQVTKLGKLRYIGKNASFDHSKFTSLGNIQTIGGSADFTNSQITNLGNLQTIGGSAVFENSQITNLGNLQSIGGSADFMYSQVTRLGKLRYIGKNAFFDHSKLTNLGNIQTIGGSAVFKNSQITSLWNLQSIGGNAFFENSQITSLGNLQTIGRDAYFSNSQITSLGNLQSIGRNAYIKNSLLSEKDFDSIKVGIKIYD